MKLSDWAHVAEIVGAIVVIITLAYLAVQIEQNTIAVEASTRQGRLDFGWQQTELLITQPGLVTLVMEAEQNADDLNHEDRLRFYEFTTWRFATWELTFQEYTDGLLDEETWAAWNGYFMLMIQPKEDERLKKTPPREVVFLVDVSGSMKGAPTEKVTPPRGE